MKSIISILYVALLLSQTGCDKEVTLVVPKAEDKLVANCIFTSDSILGLHLFESHSMEPISNAFITFFEDDMVLGNFNFIDSSLYEAKGFLAQQGSCYSIQIEVPDYELLSSYDTIPYAIPFKVISFQDSAGYISSSSSSNQYLYSSFDINFKDPPGKNFYEIYILREVDTSALILWDSTETDVIFDGISLWEQQKQSLNKHIMTLFSFDQSVTAEGFSIPEKVIPVQDILFFSDELFDRSEKTIRVNCWPYYSEPNIRSSFFIPERKFTVFFRAISEQYYSFRRTQKVYSELSLQDDIWRGTGDFVQVFSNVENGYGLFAAYSVTMDTIIVQNSFNQ